MAFNNVGSQYPFEGDSLYMEYYNEMIEFLSSKPSFEGFLLFLYKKFNEINSFEINLRNTQKILSHWEKETGINDGLIDEINNFISKIKKLSGSVLWDIVNSQKYIDELFEILNQETN